MKRAKKVEKVHKGTPNRGQKGERLRGEFEKLASCAKISWEMIRPNNTQVSEMPQTRPEEFSPPEMMLTGWFTFC
jgi:hypothetical protein